MAARKPELPRQLDWNSRRSGFSLARLDVALAVSAGPAGVKLPVLFEHW